MSTDTLDSLCESFIEKLNHCSSLNHQGQRFFPNNTAKDVFKYNPGDLRRLLQLLLHIPLNDTTLLSQIVDRILKELSTVLAILLSIRGRRVDLEQYARLIVENNTSGLSLPLTDHGLPVSLDIAQRAFPYRGHDFYEMQFSFCPVTLKKGDEVIYKDYRRRCLLPYLEEEQIGEGAFGRVWKVKIERCHWESRNGLNDKTLVFARKDSSSNAKRRSITKKRYWR